MTALVAAAVWFGAVFATNTIAVIWYDLVALQKGWRSFSRETLLLTRRFPWVAVVMTGVFCFALGCLCGHLFFPQYLP